MTILKYDPRNEGNPKNEDDPNNEDDPKNEGDYKNENGSKNDDACKFEDAPKMRRFATTPHHFLLTLMHTLLCGIFLTWWI